MAGEVVTHAADAANGGVDLVQIVALLGAGVVAVPIFRRLGLGSVLGYLVGGLLIGPFGPYPLIRDPQTILHAAELGVVLFLFIIGLEMEPSKLWSLRKQIFGLGALQVVGCGAVLTAVGVALGFPPVISFIFGMGFVLTSTAIVMQVLEERAELNTPAGQKIISILLLEDLAIVPLLAIVAVLAPSSGEVEATSRWLSIGVALGAIVGLVFVGRWILNPVFRFLADARAREVMTAAALLVVLGAALVMQMSGLSMAMGAFLAGVLLSTSTFKHQLEADVEPFRGILLGIFFLAVGMSLDLSIVAGNWQVIALAVLGFMTAKGLVIYSVARLLKAPHTMALERAVLMAQGGEFAFVLYTTAASVGIIDAPSNAIFTATVIISMALTPFTIMGMRFVMPRQTQSMEGVEEVRELNERILIIGFGRFGQIASQVLIGKGHTISIIDTDTEMIRVAATFGFKVYYGDGTRLDILRAAGAENADLVLTCVDRKDDATRIATLLRDEFPLVKVMSRAFDRVHAIDLVKAGVAFQIREMFESSITFGAEAIRLLGATEEEIADVIEGVRERDRRRFEAQVLGGWQAGQDLLISNAREQAREGGIQAPENPVLPEPVPVEEGQAR
jgi:glutathione-regulated potassium-efflux system protein KefB